MTRSELTTLILAVLIAFFLWASVRAMHGNPEEDRVIENVPINIVGEVSGLHAELHFRDTRINVPIRGIAERVNNVLREEVLATVDVSDIKRPGETRLKVNLKLPPGINLSGREPLVTVTTSTLEQKDFPVTIAFITQPPPGSTVGKYYVAPPTVTIEGTQEALNSVKYVNVFVDPTEHIATALQLVPRAVNANGETVREVSVSDPVVRVGIETVTGGQVTRQLAVRAPQLLNPPPNLTIKSIKLQPDVVTLNGTPAQLDAVKGYVDTDPIDVSAVRSNTSRTTRVRVPAGVRALGSMDIRVDLEVQPNQ
ncbi:MAG TPA: CdaR family protein [Armatimonadota bacterium]|jgi:YbbR domain-containing protein